MPFSTETAHTAGRKGGKQSAAVRWGDKDPKTVRNRNIRLAVSQRELELIDATAYREGVSRVELVVRAVIEYSAAIG